MRDSPHGRVGAEAMFRLSEKDYPTRITDLARPWRPEIPRNTRTANDGIEISTARPDVSWGIRPSGTSEAESRHLPADLLMDPIRVPAALG